MILKRYFNTFYLNDSQAFDTGVPSSGDYDGTGINYYREYYDVQKHVTLCLFLVMHAYFTDSHRLTII